MAYIDKEKLIKDIEDKRLVIQDGTSAAEAIRIQGKAIRKAIEEAPTADVEEVKHGKWIHHYDDLFPAESTQECSVCHEEQFETGLCDDNYCPNCGAKMDKEG